jgi:hypothetical protein
MREPPSTFLSAASLPRRLDPAEAFFWFMDRVSPMNFAVIAEGRGALDDGALQGGLARAQREHPLLRAGIATNAQYRLIWVAAPDAPIDYSVLNPGPDWQTPLAEAMVQPFPLDSAPLVRAVRLNGLDGHWVIALIFHHSVGDGRSGCRLLAELLASVATPDRPRAPHPGYPPLRTFYPAAYTGATGAEAVQHFKTQRKGELQRYGRFDEVPGFRRDAPTLQPRIRTLRVEADQLHRLAGRCRAAGATIHGAISAAQLLALHRAFDGAEPRTLGLTTPADLRAYLREPLDDATPLLCATLVTGVYRLERGGDFWALARAVSGDLKRQLQRGDGHLFFDLFPPPAEFPATPEGIAAFGKLMEKAPQVSLVSNVGRLAPLPTVTPFQVDALSFALCPMFSHVLFTAVGTFNRRMTLHVNFDAARLPPERADPIIEDLGATLARAAD